MVRRSGGQVVRWSSGQVVRWSGGQVVRVVRVCKGPPLRNFGISDEIYFFSAKRDNFMG